MYMKTEILDFETTIFNIIVQQIYTFQNYVFQGNVYMK